MTTNKTTSVSTPRTTRTIGTLAARKRDELNQFEAARKRSIEKLNCVRAGLQRAVEEAEAKERRRLRNLQMDNQKRIKFVLGGLMLEALRTQGSTSLHITAQVLHRLDEKDQFLLAQVLATNVSAHNANDNKVESDAVSNQVSVDIQL